MQLEGNTAGYSHSAGVPPGPAVNPLLVHLYDTHQLYKLAGERTPESRKALCDTVSGLLNASVRPVEREMVADVLISLIRQSEKDLKEALSDRLSVMDEIPLRVALQLVNDDVDVADSMLRYSRALNDLDLLYIIQSKTAEYWRIIAQRKTLGDDVVDALAETRDLPTAKNLVSNDNVTLTIHSVNVLADLAIGDDDLARPLMTRREVPQAVISKLYEYVGKDIKDIVSTTFGGASPAIMEALDDVVQEFVQTPGGNSFKPSAAMLRAAELFKIRGKLNTLLMVRTLKRGQIASFVAQFSQFCDLPVSLVIPILGQRDGQGLAIACRAYGIGREDFTAMFMLTRRVVSKDGIVGHNDVNRALSRYDRISGALAKRLMRSRTFGE